MRCMRMQPRINRLTLRGGELMIAKYDKRYLATAAEAINLEAPVIEESKKRQDGMFPWRSMPEMQARNHKEYVSDLICMMFLHYFYLNGESAIKPGNSYMEYDFILGAKTAFESSVKAIFDHKQIRAAQLLSDQIEAEKTDKITAVADGTTKESKSSSSSAHTATAEGKEAGSPCSEGTSPSGTMPIVDSDPDPESAEALKAKIEAKKDRDAVMKDLNEDAKFVPNLEGLFETKLAQFYESAISQGQKPNIKIFHKIESVGTPSIERHDILFGAKRDIDLSGLVRKHFLDAIPYMALVEKTPSNFEGLEDRKATKSENNLIDARKFATIRLLLSIPLTETFYVENCSSNTVIQGSREVQTNVHSVMFEAVLGSEKSVELEWTICDIDDWLEGNEFWQPSRTRKAPTVAPHNTNTRFKDK